MSTSLLFDDLVDRAEQLDAEAVRPLAVRLAVRAVDFSVSVSHDEFVADGVLDKLRIVIGMPLIEEIIDKTDFFFILQSAPFRFQAFMLDFR